MKPLQQYFDQASNRPPAFSEQQIRDLIAGFDAASGQTPPNAPSRPLATNGWRLLGIGLVIAALGTLVIDRSDDRSTGAVAPASSTSPAGSVAETSTVALSSPRVQAMRGQVLTDTVELSATNRTPALDASAEEKGSAAVGSVRQRQLPRQSLRSQSVRSQPLRSRAGSIERERIGEIAIAALPVASTTTLDITADDLTALGLRRLSDGRTAYGYYLVASLPKELAPNLSIDNATLLGRGYEDSLLVQTIGPEGRSDLFASRADFPLSIVTRKGSPVASSWQVITDETGRLLEERISIVDGEQLRYVASLFARGASNGEIARSVESIRGLDALAQSLRLNTLLPIRVTLGPEASNGIFWCRPEPQLIAALPARTVAQLRSELMKVASKIGTRDTVAIIRRGWALQLLATIDSIRPESLRVDTELDVLRQGMTGAEIFAGSRRTAGSIVRFEPLRNPASAIAHFRLELDQPRSVTITLHDVNGRRLRTLVKTESLDEGSTELKAPLAGIERGLYLVAIATDKREQMVHRLVVE